MDEKNGQQTLLALTVATLLFAALGVIFYTQAPGGSFLRIILFSSGFFRFAGSSFL